MNRLLPQLQIQPSLSRQTLQQAESQSATHPRRKWESQVKSRCCLAIDELWALQQARCKIWRECLSVINRTIRLFIIGCFLCGCRWYLYLTLISMFPLLSIYTYKAINSANGKRVMWSTLSYWQNFGFIILPKCLFRYKLQWYPIISYTLIFFILRYYGTPSCQSPSYFLYRYQKCHHSCTQSINTVAYNYKLQFLLDLCPS